MQQDEDYPGREPDPEEVLWERLSPLTEHDITEPDLSTLLDAALSGTGWQVAGHRVVRSREIKPTYEVVVLHHPTPIPGYGGPQWAVLAFSAARPFAEMTGAERARTIDNLPIEIGTPDSLVPWLMPPDMSFSHLPPDHPIHKQPPGPAPTPLWDGHPNLGWNRLRELAALAVLLGTVRAHDHVQADALDAQVAQHPRGPLVADYRRAIATDG